MKTSATKLVGLALVVMDDTRHVLIWFGGILIWPHGTNFILALESNTINWKSTWLLLVCGSGGVWTI